MSKRWLVYLKPVFVIADDAWEAQNRLAVMAINGFVPPVDRVEEVKS